MEAVKGQIRRGFEVHATDGYIGWVEEVIQRHGILYVHVRGGVLGDTHYYIPSEAIASVEAVPDRTGLVRLKLSTAELATKPWHELPPEDST